MRNAQFRTWNMARKLKYVKNEKRTLQDQKYGEKHWKTWKNENATVGLIIWRENGKMWKMRNAHYRTWNMAINTEKRGK